jgi:hypothetical protein
MFYVYCLLIFGTSRNTHRIYLRVALYRTLAWNHRFWFGLVFIVAIIFFGLAGGYTSLVGALHGAVSGIVRSKYSYSIRVSTGSGFYMNECFEGGTGAVSCLGQGTNERGLKQLLGRTSVWHWHCKHNATRVVKRELRSDIQIPKRDSQCSSTRIFPTCFTPSHFVFPASVLRSMSLTKSV